MVENCQTWHKMNLLSALMGSSLLSDSPIGVEVENRDKRLPQDLGVSVGLSGPVRDTTSARDLN